MENAIMQTIKYFSHFQYAPSEDEIHKFLPIKTSKKELHKVLEVMCINRTLIKSKCQNPNAKSNPNVKNSKKKLRNTFGIYENYTLPEYTKFFNKKSLRARISQKKINRIKTYIYILSKIPQIKFVGLSGTMAMNNAKKSDDIDLFVITAKNRLWYGRLVCMFAAELLGVRRHRLDKSAADKVCLNLFFNEVNLVIPKYKRTGYVAHEVLQTKPLINKDETYEKFIYANRWVKGFFPNSSLSSRALLVIPGEDPGSRKHWISRYRTGLKPSQVFRQAQDTEPVECARNDKRTAITKKNGMTKLFNMIEFVLKKLQLSIIKQHQTNEIVTDTQLWFFPEDFEKKLIKESKKPQRQY